MVEDDRSIGRATLEEADQIGREVLRHMPSPTLDPWAWLSEGMGHGLLGRLRGEPPQVPGPTDPKEPEPGVVPHPEPTPPPPGPRDPQP